MVDILLQNGAEVNAACEVICDEWQMGLREMYVRVVEMKVRVWERHWQWQTPFSRMSMDRVDEAKWHPFAHQCIWDSMYLMTHIVWHAFLAVA